ncbi:hypothetical protein IAE22_35390, partial [Bacillus sp. S34]|nr:hypothetical protein [Bacillus sp. S34]
MIVLIAVVFLVWANIVMQGTRSAALQVWRDDRVADRHREHVLDLERQGLPDLGERSTRHREVAGEDALVAHAE